MKHANIIGTALRRARGRSGELKMPGSSADVSEYERGALTLNAFAVGCFQGPGRDPKRTVKAYRRHSQLGLWA